MSHIPEPPEGTFVCWFDQHGDPFTVFYRTDQHGEPGDEERWYPAIQDSDAELTTWEELLSENVGLRGPVELISNGELAGSSTENGQPR
jgi:hypothetical protein